MTIDGLPSSGSQVTRPVPPMAAPDAGTSAAMIAVRHVSKTYPRPRGGKGGLLALDDVTFEVRSGEFISLIGASGCGKTTLLRMMSGLLPFEVGQIFLAGQAVAGVPPSIGFVFQEPALLPWRTVRANLAFALQQSPLTKAETDAAVQGSLALTGLQDFAGYYPHMLSGGMQQRAGLARALVGRPAVLFMDEPLSALDAFTRRRLQQEIGAIISRQQSTTVLVTHDVDEAIFFSDRVIVMGSAPGTVRDVLPVPLPRPRRHADLLGNPVVGELRDRVLSLVMGVDMSR